ncbi:DNA-binding response regulator [Pseudonocardiaceae bacterium YIM PH 21723]|nr:DNA-binding response regulator [Pseudonocardiaceae bacterium YIM PH 21723]
MIRVLIADDDALVRSGIRTILSSAEDIEVIAEAGNGREAVQAALTHQVDVALLDIRMPEMDGLAAATEIARQAPGVRIAMLTTFGEEENITRALADGASGFLLKDSAVTELIHAVRVVASGEAYLSPAVTRRVITRFQQHDAQREHQARSKVDTLSDRERDVLRLLAGGLSNAEIGAELHMTEGSIKTYVSRILTKLDCSNRVQATLTALAAGL